MSAAAPEGAGRHVAADIAPTGDPGVPGPPRPWRRVAEGCELAVRVIPGARLDRLGPIALDAAGTAWLGVRVRAPADQGRANEAVRRLLADALRIPVSRVALRAGATDRRKRFLLGEVESDRLEALLPSWSTTPDAP